MSAGVSVGGLSVEAVSGSSDSSSISDNITADAPVRTLSTGEFLFREGDAKAHLYQIAAGVIGVYRARIDRAPEVIEFVFPGDVLGLGYLEQQIYSARALVETRVKCLPMSALDDVVKCDHRAKQRHVEALHTEFAYRRNLLTTASRQQSTGRLAAFFLVMSELNKNEGRDPNIITESLKCGVVADWLGLDVESLGRALVDLEKRGLIEPSAPLGLHLKDVTGLESLADKNAIAFSKSRSHPNLGPEARMEA